MATDLALQALLTMLRRRQSDRRDTAQSDQGSQFTSRKRRTFLRQYDLETGMSRRGNGHDNAAAKSCFQLLKRERIRRRSCPTRAAARQRVLANIELFYNPKRTNNGMLSPVDCEIRQHKPTVAGVSENGGASPKTFASSSAAEGLDG